MSQSLQSERQTFYYDVLHDLPKGKRRRSATLIIGSSIVCLPGWKQWSTSLHCSPEVTEQVFTLSVNFDFQFHVHPEGRCHNADIYKA